MKRRLLSVILAVVLILSMAVPAFAISNSGTIANYTWEYYTSLNTTTATGTMSYLGPSQCYAYINVSVWCGQHTESYTKTDSAYAYGNATAVVENPVVTINGVSHVCSPQYGYFTGRVGSESIKTSAYFS